VFFWGWEIYKQLGSLAELKSAKVLRIKKSLRFIVGVLRVQSCAGLEPHLRL